MRKQWQIGAAIAAALVTLDTPMLRARGEGDAKAAEIVAETRKALGGEKKLASVTALSVRGEFRREMSNAVQGATFVMMGGGGAATQVSGSLEIDVLFPDKFYRQESMSGGLGLTRIDGFEGERPFLDVSSSMQGARIVTDSPANDPARLKAALKRGNTDLARLLLGLIASTQPAMPVTSTYAGQAESPDGKAHVIDVAGPDDFKARLFIDTSTHLPLMLTYADLEGRAVIRQLRSHGAPPDGGTREAASNSAASGNTQRGSLTPEQKAEIDKQVKEAQEVPRKTIEYRMFFSEYREVDGISLPHRIALGTAEKTNEEWEIKSYKVNANIKADRFKVGSN